MVAHGYSAMILAAGRGERMRPFTDHTPKPLAQVGAHRLIEWQLIRLVAAGFKQIVINHAWLGNQLIEALGNGDAYGCLIDYSAESSALETAGGIIQALPLLSKMGKKPFVCVSADIYTTYDYARLVPHLAAIEAHYPRQVAHFVLTDNPPFHPQGDMGLQQGFATTMSPKLNYGNIQALHPALFDALPVGEKLKLFPWMYQFVTQQAVTAEHFTGQWENIGTTEQLQALQQSLARATTESET